MVWIQRGFGLIVRRSYMTLEGRIPGANLYCEYFKLKVKRNRTESSTGFTESSTSDKSVNQRDYSL
jgi:hypothetical protein